ncbi:hypothetical protein [Paenibacillus sp. NPDC057934]|uniref:hypothetical protein n=1 Tax=Paenibacillus sp. NPDC057934 TaxID=3346282 RepID=UPI0036DC643A
MPTKIKYDTIRYIEIPRGGKKREHHENHYFACQEDEEGHGFLGLPPDAAIYKRVTDSFGLITKIEL